MDTPSRINAFPRAAIEGLNHALQAWDGQYTGEVYEGAYHSWSAARQSGLNHLQAERAFEKLKELFERALAAKLTEILTRTSARP